MGMGIHEGAGFYVEIQHIHVLGRANWHHRHSVLEQSVSYNNLKSGTLFHSEAIIIRAHAHAQNNSNLSIATILSDLYTHKTADTRITETVKLIIYGCYCSIFIPNHKLKFISLRYAKICVECVLSSFRSRNGILYWIVNTVALVMLIAFIPITWFKKIWILFSPINEDEPNRITPPVTAIGNYLYNTSKSIMSNGVARIAIYIISICMLTMSAMIHLVCNSLCRIPACLQFINFRP